MIISPHTNVPPIALPDEPHASGFPGAEVPLDFFKLSIFSVVLTILIAPPGVYFIGRTMGQDFGAIFFPIIIFTLLEAMIMAFITVKFFDMWADEEGLRIMQYRRRVWEFRWEDMLSARMGLFNKQIVIRVKNRNSSVRIPMFLMDTEAWNAAIDQYAPDGHPLRTLLPDKTTLQ